jgi:type II secretory pathway pseudopilin PulG
MTMIESLIVITYIALIASIVLPSLTGATRKARETNLRATVRELRAAVSSYQA